MNAAAIAVGMQAEVLLVDLNIARLRSADAIYQGHCQTVASNAYEIEHAVIDADLVVGAVLVPGARAPKRYHGPLRRTLGVGSTAACGVAIHGRVRRRFGARLAHFSRLKAHFRRHFDARVNTHLTPRSDDPGSIVHHSGW